MPRTQRGMTAQTHAHVLSGCLPALHLPHLAVEAGRAKLVLRVQSVVVIVSSLIVFCIVVQAIFWIVVEVVVDAQVGVLVVFAGRRSASWRGPPPAAARGDTVRDHPTRTVKKSGFGVM